MLRKRTYIYIYICCMRSRKHLTNTGMRNMTYCMQTVDRGLGATAKDIIFL